MRTNTLITTFALSVALAAVGRAQPPKPAPAQPPQTRPDVPTPPVESTPPPVVASERYVIGAQDTLAITVVGEPELTNKYRVDTDGSITLPYINRVAAAGRTIADLQAKIASMLKDGYLQNPQVLIDVDQYKSRNIYITGKVRSPGKIPMNGPSITLIEAMALAGSTLSDASNQITVKHQKGGDLVAVNRKDLELGKAGFDVLLEDGDVVNVPEAQRFYISGFIRNPGYYVLDPGMSVEQAIALAGGLNDRGSDRRLTATRLVNGKTTEVKLDLSDKVQSNDVIKVPSRFF